MWVLTVFVSIWNAAEKFLCDNTVSADVSTIWKGVPTGASESAEYVRPNFCPVTTLVPWVIASLSFDTLPESSDTAVVNASPVSTAAPFSRAIWNGAPTSALDSHSTHHY